jgi:ABC-type lipoprotein release transport system permease subunit
MWTLAWRNIWRKRGRSLMTAGAVASVVLLTMVYFGLVGSLENGIYDRLTSNVGHIQVHVEGWRELRDFSDLIIQDAGKLEEAITAIAAEVDIEVVSALEVAGLLEGDGRSRGVILMGLKQPAENRERYSARNLAQGELPANADLESIALGQNLAEALKVSIGDEVFMYAPGTEGYGAAAYTVVGLLDLGDPSLEARLGYISLAAAQELAAPDAVGRFELHVPEYTQLASDSDVPALRDQVQAVLPEGIIAETWREVDKSLASYLDLITPSTMIFTGIFFVLAGLLVTNTIYLSLIERVREFGVIMAVGAGRRKVMGMVLSESLLLCFSGALVGASLGLISVALMSQGFTFPVPEAQLEFYESVGFPRVLYGSISSLQIVVTIAYTLAIAVLAALLPAITAARLEPVEAMRFTG